jgi:N4-gp56 family major capsid protein
MADTRAVIELTPTQWDDQFTVEYFQDNRFAAYMGQSVNSIIQIKEDLTTKMGQTIRIPFVGQLTGDTVTGDGVLEGQEEEIGTYFDDITVNPRAKAVSVTNWSNQLSAIDLREAGREVLKDWSDRDVRDFTIATLGAVGANGDVFYANSTAAERNTWNTLNVDRVLYGRARANYNAVHATALGNVSTATGRMDRRTLSVLKRIANTATPKIAPIRMEKGGKRFFVAFMHPFAFRDLFNDLEQSNRDVTLEDKNVILFKGGDMSYDGVIVHEVDDMPVLTGVGAAGIDVCPVYLLGQQAIGYGLAKRFATTEKDLDYKRKKGVAMEAWYGMKKLVRRGTDSVNPAFIGKQVGVVTGFVAAIAD